MKFKYKLLIGAIILAFILLFIFGPKDGQWTNMSIVKPMLYGLAHKNTHGILTTKDSFKSTEPKQQGGDSSGERRCRSYLEGFFIQRFPKARPSFLNNPVTGGKYNLELDCFNEGLRLAVEYNGRQHYEYVPHFHRNKDAFQTQLYRDDMKRRLCTEAKVDLIEVSYKEKNIEQYLDLELRKRGYKRT